MFSKMTKMFAAFAVVATLGATVLASSADARTTHCWRCTGGWCCY